MKNILLFLFSFIGSCLLAQSTSQYSVRFDNYQYDCTSETFYIDLQVKANDGFPLYYISDQNYRFSYEGDVLANPRIVQELELSGAKFSSAYTAFFEPHHINGSIDTIVSYNVVLAGGSGYPVDDTRWYPVGTMAFDYIGNGSYINLYWHDATVFPPTFVGEKVGGSGGYLEKLEEGTYEDGFYYLSFPLNFFCGSIELASFDAVAQGCKTELKWTTTTETDNELFLIEKSVDGIRWNTIGEVAGAGTSLDPLDYVFYDEKITDIQQYYRLVQQDFDGTSSISATKSVRSTCFDEQIALGITDIFPNPATNEDRVTVRFFAANQMNADLVITDALGRTLKTINEELVEGANIFSFKADFLTPGVYFIQFLNGNWSSGVRQLVRK